MHSVVRKQLYPDEGDPIYSGVNMWRGATWLFVGPETMESKIFSRLTAWQNWIFNRPNAVGEQGALKVFGTGSKPKFNWERI